MSTGLRRCLRGAGVWGTTSSSARLEERGGGLAGMNTQERELGLSQRERGMV